MDERARNMLSMMGEGCRTWQLAQRMGWETAWTRRQLLRLERHGFVRRDATYSAANDIRWVPVTA